MADVESSDILADIISPPRDNNDHNNGMSVKVIFNNNNNNNSNNNSHNDINVNSDQGSNNQMAKQTPRDNHRKKKLKTALEGMCDFVTVILGV